METAGIMKRYTPHLGDETLPRIHRSDFLQWLDHNKHRFSVPLVVSGVTNPRLGEQEYSVRLTFPSRPDCLQLKLVFGPRNCFRADAKVQWHHRSIPMENPSELFAKRDAHHCWLSYLVPDRKPPFLKNNFA